MNDHLDDTGRPVVRGRGRPRIWTDDAERMRAYRARQRIIVASGTDVRVVEMLGRLASAQVTIERLSRERDELQALIERQQRTIEGLRAGMSRASAAAAVRVPVEGVASRSGASNRDDPRPRTQQRTGTQSGGLSGAQRRRAEREQRKLR